MTIPPGLAERLLIPEILSEILFYVQDDRPSLANLLRTTKAFYAAAGPLLYRDLELFTDPAQHINKLLDYGHKHTLLRHTRTLNVMTHDRQACRAMTLPLGSTHPAPDGRLLPPAVLSGLTSLHTVILDGAEMLDPCPLATCPYTSVPGAPNLIVDEPALVDREQFPGPAHFSTPLMRAVEDLTLVTAKLASISPAMFRFVGPRTTRVTVQYHGGCSVTRAWGMREAGWAAFWADMVFQFRQRDDLLVTFQMGNPAEKENAHERARLWEGMVVEDEVRRRLKLVCGGEALKSPSL